MKYLFYQLEVAVILIIFYSIYRFIISNSTLFFQKRIYLLSSVLLSFIIPFLNIQINHPLNINYSYLLNEVVVTDLPEAEEGFSFGFYSSILYLVLSVSILLFCSYLTQLYKLMRIYHNSSKTLDNQYKVIHTQHNEAFSIFNYIFLDAQMNESDKAIVCMHEKAHSDKFHSIDILIITLFTLMQWFNPVIWLFMRAIKENHEFEVDKSLLVAGVSIDKYQELMLNQLFRTQALKFSSFNHNSFIKKRIKMMTKINLPAGKTRFYLAIVLSLCVLTLFSFKDKSTDTFMKVTGTNSNIANLQGEEPVSAPEVQATFQGKDVVEFTKYIATHLIYPDVAKKNKQEGKIYVQFIVEKDGTIMETKVIRSAGYELLDKEAVRVIKESPAWSPAKDKGVNVRQIFTLPVVFKLQ